MDYRIEEHPGCRMAGIELRVTPAGGRAMQDIMSHWKRFFEDGVAGAVPSRKGAHIVAVYSDYDGDYTQPYGLTLGAEVEGDDDAPEGMVNKVIHPGKFAVFTVEGTGPEAFGAAWQGIWETPLERAYTADFEFYSADSFVDADNHPVEIWIALK